MWFFHFLGNLSSIWICGTVFFCRFFWISSLLLASLPLAQLLILHIILSPPHCNVLTTLWTKCTALQSNQWSSCQVGEVEAAQMVGWSLLVSGHYWGWALLNEQDASMTQSCVKAILRRRAKQDQTRHVSGVSTDNNTPFWDLLLGMSRVPMRLPWHRVHISEADVDISPVWDNSPPPKSPSTPLGADETPQP